MPRKPVARDAVLDAFEDLLIGVGERAATLDAVAKRAGVSKGGLLYHFPNKEALITAMLERLDSLAGEDLALMAAAPEGAAAYFIRSSLWSDSPMDRSFLAASRLAEVAHVEARRRFAAIQRQWLDLIAADVGSGMAKAVLYMGDGLYLNAMWEGGPASSSDGLKGDGDVLLAAVERLRS
ncbi:TetR/AcrR family transcriptional regulator [Arthrobacter sp. UYCo732]|uniref:TetR/AcrR family transcriptional regulator n=1 Tax=Arthrobacter sp. UYCo732 TaxID=3156336 RepID=UPI003391B291